MQRFNRFFYLLKNNLPEFNIAYKNNSILMKLIGFILFFNKKFMNRFTTTIGQTVYFPSSEHIEENEMGAISTLAHEYVHAKDASAISNLLFSFLYLLPLSLAPFMLLFAFIHWGLALALFLLFLAPLPAFFRMRYELRGYTMSLFIRNAMLKERGVGLEGRKSVLNSLVKNYEEHFVGPNYYFMWPFGVKDKLHDKVKDILLENTLDYDIVFTEVLEAFNKSKK